MEKRVAALENAVPLAAPYQREIGNVTFVVSSFGNPKAADSAKRLILRLLEERATLDSCSLTRKCA